MQNKLFNVLTRGRFHAVSINGDLKKAFLQVRIRPEDRDALRFHWLYDKDPQRVRTLRFSRAIFRLTSSPFLLGGVIKQHLNTCRTEYPECVQEIERDLYIDDLIWGGSTVQEASKFKDTATEIFSKAAFQLQKWHSNVNELELEELQGTEDSLGFAKQQLVVKAGECGLLGLKWDKTNDTLAVEFPPNPANSTKRGILGKLAKI